MVVVFEWIGLSVGSGLGYSWSWTLPQKTEVEIVAILQKEEGQMLGEWINI